eukprot:m.137194 g.137194  ORF g.137194 m.137194 type:complete len:220 (+) comp14003_c0_seq9:50-709(+)
MSKLRNFAGVCRNIVCVGRNYSAHAAELGNAVPKAPMLFIKPPSCILTKDQGPIQVPLACKDMHHEVELGIIISKRCQHVTAAQAMDYVGGYTVALDMTARDLQQTAKDKGHPWSVAKGFDTFLPVGDFVPTDQVANPQALRLWCQVDGEMKQDGNTKDMIFDIPTLISFISDRFTLDEGDLILTGTPAGVGPLCPGQTITAGVDTVDTIEFKCVQRDY